MSGPDAPPADRLTLVLSTAAETAGLGRRIATLAAAGDVLALCGGLGAGKTCLAQGVGAGLGVSDHVPSPTFNIMLAHRGRLTMYHFDLYRLERAQDLEEVGFFDSVEADGLTVIEWADRFPDELPDDRLDVTLEPLDGERRQATLVAHGPRSLRLLGAVADGGSLA